MPKGTNLFLNQTLKLPFFLIFHTTIQFLCKKKRTTLHRKNRRGYANLSSHTRARERKHLILSKKKNSNIFYGVVGTLRYLLHLHRKFGNGFFGMREKACQSNTREKKNPVRGGSIRIVLFRLRPDPLTEHACISVTYPSMVAPLRCHFCFSDRCKVRQIPSISKFFRQ